MKYIKLYKDGNLFAIHCSDMGYMHSYMQLKSMNPVPKITVEVSKELTDEERNFMVSKVDALIPNK